MKKTLAPVFLDVSEKHQYIISKGDLFVVSEDPCHPGASHLGYLGQIPKKLMKKIKALC